MNKCKYISSLLFICVCLLFCGKSVKAEERAEKELKVNITNIDGERILLKENGILYTAVPIVFKPELIDGNGGIYYYSVSLDQGKNFGGYVEMEGESITLYQDEENVPKNSFVLRFKYVSGEGPMYVNRYQAESEDAKIINDECAEHEDEDFIENISELDESTSSDEILYPEITKQCDREIVSRDYHIQFDNDVPQINVRNPQVLDDWLISDSLLYVEVGDNTSGINKISVSCEDRIIIDEYCENTIAEEKVYEIPLDMESEGEEGRSLLVKVCDKAGNITQMSYNYYLDKSSPLIDIQGAPGSMASTEEIELSIVTNDNCSNECFVDYVLVKSDGEKTITDEVHDSRVAFGETFTINAVEEGDYHITAVARDYAGNYSEEKVIDFRVDSKAPEIFINGVSENTDMLDKATVEVSVAETFYENCNVSITVLRKKDEELINLPVTSFVMESPNDVRQMTLVNDGDYSIHVEAIDCMGRVTTADRNFRVDSHAPLINFSNIEDGEITNKKPVIKVDTVDSFYDSTIVDAVLSKKLADDCYSVVDEKKYVMKAKQDTSEFVIENEGEYRLTCVASDRTGNVASEKIDFVVDYTPPVISGIEDANGKYFKTYVMPDKFSEFVSDFTNINIEAFLNNRSAKEGEVILEEGKYVLWVGAVDEADNYSEAEATFIIDHTMPQVIISGIHKDGNVKIGDKIVISLMDKNDELSEVNFNGRNVQIDNNENKAEIEISDYGDYKFEIKAKDNAGNEIDKTIQTSCIMAKPFMGYSKEEKIIHKIPEKIVNNDNTDIDYVGIVSGTIIAIMGIAGLVAREMSRLKEGF